MLLTLLRQVPPLALGVVFLHRDELSAALQFVAQVLDLRVTPGQLRVLLINRFQEPEKESAVDLVMKPSDFILRQRFDTTGYQRLAWFHVLIVFSESSTAKL
ncbi:MAG: hypothetical protein ABI837_15945, partial [Acidobacteriota bacterium]